MPWYEGSLVSRVVHLNLDQGVVVIRCMSENVGVAAIERLSSGGVAPRLHKQRGCGPDAQKAQGLCDCRSSDARKASAAKSAFVKRPPQNGCAEVLSGFAPLPDQ